MSHNRFALLLLTCLSLSLLCSCRKKTVQQEPERETETATDNNTVENSDNDITAIGFQLSENNGVLSTYKTSGETALLALAPCATVTPKYVVNGTSTVVTSYTVDFGTQGCVCADSRTRKGKLIFDLLNVTTAQLYYRNPGFKMTVQSSNYAVDNHTVTINSKTVENTTPSSIPPGTNPGINLSWKIVSSLNVVKPDGKTISWQGERTKELINTSDPACYKGQSLPIDWTKAKIRLNGEVNGQNARGENYSAKATNLVRDFTCSPNGNQPHRHPFISGKLVYQPGSRAARTIDFGNGSCDFNITITVNGQTYAYTLP